MFSFMFHVFSCVLFKESFFLCHQRDSSDFLVLIYLKWDFWVREYLCVFKFYQCDRVSLSKKMPI